MKRSNKLIALLLIGTLSLSACGNQDTNTDAPAETKTEEKAEETPAENTEENAEEATEDNAESTEESSEQATEDVEVKEISGEELDKIEEDNKEKEKYLVIDVRSLDDYNNGHIKHALSIPAEELESRLAEIEAWKDQNVVVYANKADDSKEAYKTLVDNGFTNVMNAAGIEDFTYTTITKAKTVLGEEFINLVDSGEYTVIDGRDAKDYDEGHIPGAINVPSDQVDELLPTLPTDKPYLVHCYSGNKSFGIADKLASEGKEVINAFDGTKEYDGYDLSEK